MIKSLTILGSTGSIGRQSVAVAEHLHLPVAALTTNRKIDLLEEQARRLHPVFVAAYDPQSAAQLKTALADTDIRRCDFNQLIIIDELNGAFQCKNARRYKFHGFVTSFGTYSRCLLVLSRVDFHVHVL